MDPNAESGELTGPVLDPDIIEGLRELGGDDDPGLVLELVEMFLDDAPKRLEEMIDGLDREDIELMRRSAHTLKSSAANMGAMFLSQVCRQMEDAARNENVESYRDMFTRCRTAYEQSEEELRKVS